MENDSAQILKDIEKELIDIGLSEKEARAYLALLRLGSQPASVIAKELGLSRSTAQFILEMLVKKQFTNKVIRKKILFYTPEPPENLGNVLELEKNNYLEQIQVKKDKVASLIPEFSKIIIKQLMLPKIKYYEGVEGVKKMYLELLDRAKEGERIDSIEEKGDMAALLGDFCQFYIKARVEKGVYNRVISPEDNHINCSDKKLLMEARLVDPKKYPLPGDIKIGETMVCLADFTKSTPVGVIIESQALVKHFKLIFQMLWDHVAKKKHVTKTTSKKAAKKK